ncbi:MAG: helix-turn-helix transcriptional regulator [Clostridia bacterium]|nr:helix-turn-helix transcriptional regulator [Clostridia bacterium]
METLFDNVIITSILTCRNQTFPVESVSASPRGTHGIVYCIEGNQEFEYKDITLKAGKDSVIYLPQGLPYMIRRFEKSVDIFVNFRTMGKESGKPFSKVFLNHERILNHLKRIENIIRTRPYGYNDEAKGELYLLISEINRGERIDTGRSPSDKSVTDAMEAIESGFGDPELSVQMIKSGSGLSDRYFEKRFKRITGLTPKDYLTSVRLEKAKEYLSSTEMKIEEISLICGFNDQCNFTRLFKKKLGCSPSEYRKEYSSIL